MITVPEVHYTRDYGKFKCLAGNRRALAPRVNKILKSIKKIGYIPVPIVVNEKFEIIDGNGRFEALKQLWEIVYYIVIPGLGIEHCVSMNINSTNWTTNDFVESYATLGNENYIRLQMLMQKYPQFTSRVITAAATNAIGGTDNKTIKEEQLKIDESSYLSADSILEWVTREVADLKPYIKGRFDLFICSIIFCYKYSSVNLERLVQVLHDYKYDIPPVTDIAYELEQISKLYNRNVKKYPVYLNVEYNKWCSENNPSYDNRWGVRGKVAV